MKTAPTAAPSEKKGPLWDQFKAMDTDGTGKLNAKELSSKMHSTNCWKLSSQLQEALLKLEKEENGAGDGLIDFEEFQRIVVKSKAKQLFSSLDTDGSNTVKRSEFRKKVNEDPDIAKMIKLKGGQCKSQ